MTDLALPPPLPPSPSDAEVIDFLQRLHVWLRTREPQADGAIGDKFVPYSALSDLGALGGNTLVIGGGDGGGGGTPDTTPPTPIPLSGFTVVGGITQFIVEFQAPTYTEGGGNAYTEIYAANWDGVSALPTFASAALVATATGSQNVIAIPAQPGQTTHFWLGAVTRAGVRQVDGAGPTGGINGVSATTGVDVSDLLEILTGQLTESQLYANLNTRIDLIDGSGPGSVNARVSALAAVKSRTFYAATAPVSDGDYTLQANDIWFDSDNNNRPHRYNGSTWVDITDTRLTTAITDISDETDARITADTAEVSARESLYAALSGTGASGYKVYNQAAEPTGLGASDVGAIWTWKTGAGVETFKRWSGSAWVDSVSNKRAATYRGAYTTAALPTTGSVIGDVALRTDDNVIVVWNGTTWVVRTVVDPVAALVAQETSARISDVEAEANRIDTVDARLTTGGDVYESIVTAQTTATSKSATFTQSATPTATKVGDLWVHTGNGNILKRWNGSSWVLADDARIGTTANQVTTLQSTVNGHGDDIAALEISASTFASDIGDLEAQYTVKVNLSGYVSGFGLASTLNNATPYSEFVIVADKFSIAPVATSHSAADGSPFFHLTAPTSIGGVSVPAGTYMKAAYIHDATITNAKIANLAVDDAKIASLSAAKITAGTLDAARIGAGSITADKISVTSLSAVSTATGALTVGSTITVGSTGVGGIIKSLGKIFAGATNGYVFETLSNGTVRAEIGNGTYFLRWNTNGVLEVAGNVLIGDMQVSTNGKLRSGKTGYGSGTGWLIEYNGGNPRFDVGNSTKYLRWSGTDLLIGGDIIATGNVKANNITKQWYDQTFVTTALPVGTLVNVGVVPVTQSYSGSQIIISCTLVVSKGSSAGNVAIWGDVLYGGSLQSGTVLATSMDGLYGGFSALTITVPALVVNTLPGTNNVTVRVRCETGNNVSVNGRSVIVTEFMR